MARCPNNTFINTTNSQCLKSTDCPPNYWGNPINGQCVQYCPVVSGVQMYADKNPNVKMCVYVCPTNYFIQN